MIFETLPIVIFLLSIWLYLVILFISNLQEEKEMKRRKIKIVKKDEKLQNATRECR